MNTNDLKVFQYMEDCIEGWYDFDQHILFHREMEASEPIES